MTIVQLVKKTLLFSRMADFRIRPTKEYLLNLLQIRKLKIVL